MCQFHSIHHKTPKPSHNVHPLLPASGGDQSHLSNDDTMLTMNVTPPTNFSIPMISLSYCSRKLLIKYSCACVLGISQILNLIFWPFQLLLTYFWLALTRQGGFPWCTQVPCYGPAWVPHCQVHDEHRQQGLWCWHPSFFGDPSHCRSSAT